MKAKCDIFQLRSQHGGAFLNLGDPGDPETGCYWRGVAVWGNSFEGEGVTERSRLYVLKSNHTFCLMIFDDDEARQEWEKANPHWDLAWPLP